MSDEGQPLVLGAPALGEMSQRVFLGVPIAPDGEESSTPAFGSMKYVWRNASDEQRAESRAIWGALERGSERQQLGSDAHHRGEEVGIILDEADAREGSSSGSSSSKRQGDYGPGKASECPAEPVWQPARLFTES